jgi:hypothetical protein
MRDVLRAVFMGERKEEKCIYHQILGSVPLLTHNTLKFKHLS